MTVIDETTRPKRENRSSELVDKLVRERTELLALLWRVAGIDSYAGKKGRANPEKDMQDFCQMLTDYVAAGHFLLYGRIVSGNERRRKVLELAEKFYRRIEKTTQAALDFNDKYNTENHGHMTDELRTDLSELGEELTVRIELEDKLLDALIGK